MSHLLDYAKALSESLGKPMPSEEDLAGCTEKRDVRHLFKSIEKVSKPKKKEVKKSGEVKESKADSTVE